MRYCSTMAKWRQEHRHDYTPYVLTTTGKTIEDVVQEYLEKPEIRKLLDSGRLPQNL
jgi:hypothetical protein